LLAVREGCKVPNLKGLKDESALLHALMLGLASNTDALYMSGTLLLLISHKDYRAGVRVEDLWLQVVYKHEETEAWVSRGRNCVSRKPFPSWEKSEGTQG